MKRLYLIFICVTISIISNSQVISTYESLFNNPDTTIALKYLKTIDKELQHKIDSFILLIKKEQPNDTGFIEIMIYNNRLRKPNRTFCTFENTYRSYKTLVSKFNPHYNVIFFSFYKNYILVFTTIMEKLKVRKTDCTLFEDILYQQMSKRVQCEILLNSDTLIINNSGLCKSYYLNKTN